MADDVLLNKAAAIERAVRRVREEYAGDDRNQSDSHTQDYKNTVVVLSVVAHVAVVLSFGFGSSPCGEWSIR